MRSLATKLRRHPGLLALAFLPTLALVVVYLISLQVEDSTEPVNTPTVNATQSQNEATQPTTDTFSDADLEFFDRVRAFEAAFLTPDINKKMEMMEPLVTPEYAANELNPELAEAQAEDDFYKKFTGIIARVHPNADNTDITSSGDEQVRFVTTRVRADTLRGDELVNPFRPAPLHSTTWVNINGEWRVIYEGYAPPTDT